MTKALIPLAPGCEEMEAVIVIDVFRRAGWEVVAAAVSDRPLVCSRGVHLVADAAWDAIDPAAFDVLALPGGGPGTDALRTHEGVLAAVRAFHEVGKIVAAVCAAPLVLQAAGILQGRRVTCHPASAAELTAGLRVDEAVVRDGNLITSQGPGTSFAFALAVVEAVEDHVAADRLADAMVLGRSGPPLP